LGSVPGGGLSRKRIFRAGCDIVGCRGMRRAFLLALAVLGAMPVFAGSLRESLYGTWGTEGQCRGALIVEGGTVRASPVDIDERWLAQGGIFCVLTWFGATERPGELFASAHAVCGEDSAQGYRLDFVLRRDSHQMTLIWDERLFNGPLTRCDTR